MFLKNNYKNYVTFDVFINSHVEWNRKNKVWKKKDIANGNNSVNDGFMVDYS